jgi:multidrug resistance efflux pump
MANPFPRTIRSLRGEEGISQLLFPAACALLLAVWALWLVRARFPVYVASEAARLEAERAPVPIAAQVGGRLRRVAVTVGQTVAAGELLAELEGNVEIRRLEEERAKLAALGWQLADVRAERESKLQGLAAAGRSLHLLDQEAAEKARSAAMAAHLAAEELRRKERLHAEGVVPEAELARARNEAEQRRSEAAGLEIARDRLASERARDEADRAAALRDAERRMASLEGDLGAQEAIVRRLEEESRWRSIRAPFAGQIGELARFEAGALVQPGERLGTLVPTHELEILGGFPPATALGRIRPGQRAEVRLDAFPWTEFGALPARVMRVSSELRDGRIWVELALEPGPASRIPLQHGLSGSVLVETERLSPAGLLLRTLGKTMSPVRSRKTGEETPGTTETPETSKT